DYIRKTKILHLTGVFAAINSKNIRIFEHAAKLAKKHNVQVSFDPNIRSRLWSIKEAWEGLCRLLPYVDFVFTSEEEAKWLFGEKTLEQYITTIKIYGPKHIAIKRGEKGSIGYCNGEIVKVPAKRSIKVVDTVGAGDGFNAGYIYSYLNEKGVKRVVRIFQYDWFNGCFCFRR